MIYPSEIRIKKADRKSSKAKKGRCRAAYRQGYRDGLSGRAKLGKNQKKDAYSWYLAGFDVGLVECQNPRSLSTISDEDRAERLAEDAILEAIERAQQEERARLAKEEVGEAKKRFYNLVESQSFRDAGLRAIAAASGITHHQARGCWSNAVKRGLAQAGSLGREYEAPDILGDLDEHLQSEARRYGYSNQDN